MILKIINVSPKLEENAVKYQIKHEPSRFTLTSIIDEEDDQLTVVKNILTNLNSQNLLWENHSLINRDIEIDLVERNPSINNIPDLERQMDEKKKFMSFTNSKLINKENALKDWMMEELIKNILNECGYTVFENESVEYYTIEEKSYFFLVSISETDFKNFKSGELITENEQYKNVLDSFTKL